MQTLAGVKVLSDVLLRSARLFPDRPAFTHAGSTLSYAQLDRLSSHFAGYLQFTGTLVPHDRVAIMLPNLLHYPVTMFGAMKANMVVVNVNPNYGEEELRHILRDSGARVLVTLEECLEQVELVIDDTNIAEVIVADSLDLHPFSQRVFTRFFGLPKKYRHYKYALPHLIGFRKVLRIGQAEMFVQESVAENDIALLQYTGGTTGVAKGAVLRHRQLIANMNQLCVLFEGGLDAGYEVVVAPLPLYHIYSFTLHCLMMTSFGARMVLIPDWRDRDVLVSELARYQCTFFAGLNTLFVGLCHHPSFLQLDFSALKITCSGGAPLSDSVAAEWLRITGCPLVEGYGLTEASPVISANYPYQPSMVSVGKALVGTECKVLNEEGELLSYGEKGELWVKGPQVIDSYWNMTDETAVVIKDGWFETGDIVYIDQLDYLHIVDRKKDMIKVSGFPVYPSELEKVISCHPDVKECAVIGLPDESTGEQIKLFVVSSNPRLNVRDIREYCRERLTSYKVPRLVEFKQSLPHTPVGKVLRRQLRDEALALSSNTQLSTPYF